MKRDKEFSTKHYVCCHFSEKIITVANFNTNVEAFQVSHQNEN